MTTTELSKNFEPKAVETKWTQHWKNNGYFNSQPDDRPAFTIVIPPPNVTGVLHMGHTLNETVQDILVRRARMTGYNACWVPGSDHASIATESKVVQMLKEKGIDKASLSRAEFLQYAFEWKEKYGGIIYNQIERLGCSVDWNRTTFTMDEHYHKAVIKTFVRLYNEGLIYRGARMINWDPAAKTALSDEEVEHRDVEGKLYYIKYKIISGDNLSTESPAGDNIIRYDAEPQPDKYIIIATQRPETIMGDVAVCVHPTDERYQHLRGSYAVVPLINRKVPVIFDEYIDPAFGTGVLKVTPAHDINDYNIGLKHNLPIIDTLNEDGTLSEAAEIYIGVDRFEARKKIVAELQENGFLLKDEPNPTRMGYSQRSGAVVEPRISTQWFLKMKEMAPSALDAVIGGSINIHPGDRFMATYKHWLENVKDWCISRQLWWGQQIPAWYDDAGNVYVAETEEEANNQQAISNRQQAISNRQQTTGNGQNAGSIDDSRLTIHALSRDADVLDTWFSSWLWPMEVFNGITAPGNAEIAYYYPTSVLVTGQDIIFFWVARMIMAGLYFEKKIPFNDVYFTGMVRDKLGRKMSKQLGNSPDLLNLIDQYGADAVRFGIMISSPAGNDLLFDEASLEQGRFFNNKLWNALKLVKMWQSSQQSAVSNQQSAANSQKPFAIRWFSARLNQVKAEINQLIGQFRLSEALKVLYSLIWDDFCSWYLEWVKPPFGEPMNADVYQITVQYFTALLALLHPYMPFITEEIYHLLEQRNEGDDLCMYQYAPAEALDESLLADGEKLKKIITALREARVKNNLKQKDAIELSIQTSQRQSYHAFETILQRQINTSSIDFINEPPAGTITLVIDEERFFIQSLQPIDTSAQKATLEADLVYQQNFLNSVNKKLGNEKFVQNARPEVVALEQKKAADAQARINVINESLAGL